ncbi:MAG: DUF4349 domain-containing protein [Anaerolineales bacterium]|nr:DUF4349 domain-containing protein [Anaerolineales bacterium]
MRKHIVILSVLILLLTSCAVGSSGYDSEVLMERAAPMAKGVDDSYYGDTDNSVSSVSYEDQAIRTQSTQERMVIKNASLSIVVEEPGVTLDAISALAADMGGFVVTSNLYRIQVDGGLEVPQANITIRVPAEKLDQALTEIKSGAGQILNENVSGQDVTQEYTDLESRLRNLENAEIQLTEIMENAYETEDVLSVYNRLVEVQEQIELIKGQMQYYQQSAALSAISVNIQANEAVQPLKIGNWQPVGVAKRAIQALINTLELIANLLIWVALYMLPVALVLFFPIRWIWKGLKRFFAWRKEKKNQKNLAKAKDK